MGMVFRFYLVTLSITQETSGRFIIRSKAGQRGLDRRSLESGERNKEIAIRWRWPIALSIQSAAASISPQMRWKQANPYDLDRHSGRPGRSKSPARPTSF